MHKMAATRWTVVCCLLGIFVFRASAAPVFGQPTYTGTIGEDAPIGTSVSGVSIRATGTDVTYTADGVCIQKDNSVRTTRTFNRRMGDSIQIPVTATDASGEKSTAMLILTLADINDNAPEFDLPTYKVKIPEDTPNGTNFLNVSASDFDVGDNARVEFAVQNNNLFTMDTLSSGTAGRYIGLLLVNGRLDYDRLANHRYEVVVTARDFGQVRRTSTTTVTVEMQNVSDEPPVFQGINQTVKFRRNAKTNSIVTMVRASDPDGDGVTFSFPNPTSENDMFSIDNQSGLVRLTGSLPSADQTLMINVVARDDGSCCSSPPRPSMSTNDTLKIQIVRTYDSAPVFRTCSSYEGVTIEENKPVGTSVLNVTATDSLNTNLVTYGFPDEQTNLAINSSTGEITISSLIDRERLDQILVTVQAADRGSPPLTGFCTFLIRITDVNDVDPKFDLVGDIRAFVRVNAPANTYISCMIANDTDEGANGQISYQMVAGGNSGLFAVDANGIVRTAQVLSGVTVDQELIATVLARDGGTPSRNVTKTLRVTVVAATAALPQWNDTYSARSFSVNETAIISTGVNIFQATAGGVKINYNLVSDAGLDNRDATGDFIIDLNTGQLSIYQNLDYLRRRSYRLRVQSVTQNNIFAETCPTIQVLDTNNQAPEFAKRPAGSAGYFRGLAKENSTEMQIIAEVRATDRDTIWPDNKISFRIENSSQPYTPFLNITNKNNYTGQIQTTFKFDYENATDHRFLLGVIAYDGSPSTRPGMNGQANSATVSVSVIVINTNDNSPTLQVATPVVRIREDEPLDRAIASVTAYDPDVVKDDPDQIDSLFFTIVNGNTGNYFGVRSGINVNSNIPGEIFLLRHLDYETLTAPESAVGVKTLTLTVQVEDSDPTHTGQASITIEVQDVNDNAPVWNLSPTNFNITEGETNRTLVQLTATDRDSGVNAQVGYRVDRSTDPDYAFSISANNNLMLSQPLTRDRNLKPLLRILAIDNGSPPMTSTATLTLTVIDINDHAPVLTGQYNLQVPEGQSMQGQQVGVVTATDADGAPNAEPFTFSCDSNAPSDNACNFFSVQTDPNGGGGKGAGRITVTRSEAFDREQRKTYALPVLVRDVGGLSATSWVTITIGDKNDNPHTSGNQDIYVLNYLNQFGPGPVGRVYCPDADDWDLPDKTFIYSPPTDQTAYFSVGAYGVVTMQPHVNGSHEFSVTVTDNVRGGAVSCSVKVQVSELLKEAPYRTGSARIQGLTAEDFVKPQQTGRFNSKFEAFRGLLADKIALPVEDVFIVSVNNYVPARLDVRQQNYVDIHFSAVRGDDWYSPSQVEAYVVRNLAEFEALIGQTFSMVPIKACPDVSTGCCATEFQVSTTPQVVNGNGTARVGVTVTSKARIVADERPSCDPGYCYNGGTCVEGAWDEFTCECPPGFDGPRCQRLSRQFTGQGPLLLPPLYSCIDSDISLEFSTSQADVSLLYNGPISARDTTAGKPEDFFSLALVGGKAQVRVSNGFRQETLVTGSATLNDNQWHRLDVLRRGQMVWLVVDQCRGASTSDQDCRKSGVIPLQHRSLDVYTHLQVGGYFTQGSAAPYPTGIPATAFLGCIRNLTHNGQLYDLHVVGESNSPSCSCGSACGCPLGTRGSNCETNSTALELVGENSFFLWTLKPAFLAGLRQSPFSFSLALLFRTQDSDGVLLHVTSNNLYLTVRVVESKLRADYNLGGGARTLELPGVLARSGQWLGLTVSTVGRGVAMQVDGGEDRYYVRSSDPEGSQSVFWSWQNDTQVVVGCQLTSAGACTSGTALARTVIKDVRVAGEWLPLRSTESQASSAADLTNNAGLGPEQVPEDCPADRCKNEDSHICSPDCTCKARWFSYTCGCGPGYREAGCAVGSGCILIDDPCRPNPCWNGGTCLSSGLGATCNCVEGWTGPFCLSRADKYVEPGPAAANIGLIIGVILGVLALLILIIVIVLLLMRRKPSDEKRVLEIYPDDDIRENVISYDEEGAGEADNAAFDIARLQVGDAEAGTVPRDYGKTNSKPLGHSALPPYDKADQPAVGDTVNRRLDDADNDPDAPPYDSTIPFNLEGGGSDAGSLSSIESASTDRSQDFDYLNDWGDKFAKLADMYGAGAGSPRSPGGDSDL